MIQRLFLRNLFVSESCQRLREEEEFLNDNKIKEKVLELAMG